jgi:hypothetical protein
MPTLADDQTYFRKGVHELEEYLLSKELFWPLTAGTNLPRLTIGGLLLSRIRLRAWAFPTQKAGDINQTEQDLTRLRAAWPAAWERKATQEVHARLARWQDFLMEYQRSPDQHEHFYPHEVQGRVILQILRNEPLRLPSAWQTLDALDLLVRRAWLPGAFIWEEDLTDSFPAAEYWYLYGKLKS